ncbi:reverse transcriptase domain-containing protein [Tanacetum coccineum]
MHDNRRHDNRRQEVNHLRLESLTKLPSKVPATELQLQIPPCPPMVAPLKTENLDRYCDYDGEKGHYTNDCYHLKRKLEAVLVSRKLNHLVKDVRQRGNNRGRHPGNNNGKGRVINMILEGDEDRKRKGQRRGLLGAKGVRRPRKVELEVKFGGSSLFQRTMLKFTVVRASSPYNIILGHTRMRELGVISSTIRSMMLRHEEEREVMRLEELEDPKVEKVLVNPSYLKQKNDQHIKERRRIEVPGLHGYLEGDQVSGVLVADRKGKQIPIRYVSRTLHKAEQNYAPLEKLALCLLHLFRRLRRYFKAHPIKVFTDQPIKQMLNKAKVSRKLAKYAVELEAYNITLVGKDNPKEWTLYKDRASSLKGVKVGLVLIDPSSKEYSYAIRLTFPSTNNETEYEALLAGLRIACKMKVQALKVKNQKADVLSKLALVAFNHLTKKVLTEVLKVKSVDTQEVNKIVEEEEDIWMTLIIKCLEEEVWPTNENEAKTLRMKISQYTTEEGVLFKKSYLSLMLRCVEPLQANYMHAGARSVVAKNIPRLQKTRLTSIMSPWPFYQWGLDILGPLSKGPGKPKSIIVAIDYFTKWMEAKPLAKTTSKKARIGRERVGWVDELPNILWAHQTMLKTSNDETLFSLTYGSEAIIPSKIGMPTYRTIQFNEAQNEEEMRLNLDLIQERRETSTIREAKYKKKVK